IYADQGSRWGLQISVKCKARAKMGLELYEQAEEDLLEGIRVTDEIGATHNSTETYLMAGNMFNELGKPERAVGCFQKGIRIAEDLEMAYWAARGYVSLATTTAELGRTDESEKGFRKALEYCLKLDDRDLLEGTLQSYRELLEKQGNHEGATRVADCLSPEPDSASLDSMRNLAKDLLD
ncbi:hypothetical protein GF402_11895, partial [Candidatus Fermentibacteria bacterium]|nr:hypothetical protein [Candidatus Fermentibacteria bacterium]